MTKKVAPTKPLKPHPKPSKFERIPGYDTLDRAQQINIENAYLSRRISIARRLAAKAINAAAISVVNVTEVARGSKVRQIEGTGEKGRKIQTNAGRIATKAFSRRQKHSPVKGVTNRGMRRNLVAEAVSKNEKQYKKRQKRSKKFAKRSLAEQQPAEAWLNSVVIENKTKEGPKKTTQALRESAGNPKAITALAADIPTTTAPDGSREAKDYYIGLASRTLKDALQGKRANGKVPLFSNSVFERHQNDLGIETFDRTQKLKTSKAEKYMALESRYASGVNTLIWQMGFIEAEDDKIHGSSVTLSPDVKWQNDDKRTLARIPLDETNELHQLLVPDGTAIDPGMYITLEMTNHQGLGYLGGKELDPHRAPGQKRPQRNTYQPTTLNVYLEDASMPAEAVA